MPAEKLPCRVERSFDGLFHLHQHELQPADDEEEGGTTVWYGVIDLACSTQEATAIWGKDVLIELEDGRVGHARCLSASLSAVYIATDDAEPGEACLLYVVGLTDLARPLAIDPALLSDRDSD